MPLDQRGQPVNPKSKIRIAAGDIDPVCSSKIVQHTAIPGAQSPMLWYPRRCKRPPQYPQCGFYGNLSGTLNSGRCYFRKSIVLWMYVRQLLTQPLLPVVICLLRNAIFLTPYPYCHPAAATGNNSSAPLLQPVLLGYVLQALPHSSSPPNVANVSPAV